MASAAASTAERDPPGAERVEAEGWGSRRSEWQCRFQPEVTSEPCRLVYLGYEPPGDLTIRLSEVVLLDLANDIQLLIGQTTIPFDPDSIIAGGIAG